MTRRFPLAVWTVVVGLASWAVLGLAILGDVSESATKIQVNTNDPQNISNKTFDSTNMFSGTLIGSSLTANSIPILNGSKIYTSTANPTNGQLLIGSTGTMPVLGAITGTANRVTVSLGPGTINLSAPQDLHTASTPTFAGVRVPYNTYFLSRNASDSGDVGLIKLNASSVIEFSTTVKNPTLDADPVSANQCATKGYVDGLPQVSGFTTGDVKLTIKTVADTGWVLMNDGTIGNAGSGATTRANADTSSLYTLMWTNCPNTNCAVSGGSGASAAADFSANKTLALPKALGRALASSGSGSGLTARTMGEALGAENAIVVSHSHTLTDPGHTHTESGATGPDGYSGTTGGSGQFGTRNTGNNTTGITVNSAGSSGTGANMQPTLFLSVMIKL